MNKDRERGWDVTDKTEYLIQEKHRVSGEWVYLPRTYDNLDDACESCSRMLKAYYGFEIDDPECPLRVVMRHVIEVVL